MNTFQADNANMLFHQVASAIDRQTQIVSPRGLKTKELYQAFLTLNNPLECICTLNARQIDLEYAKKELEWYLSGNLEASIIGEASKFWLKLQDPNGTVNSNYGYLALKQKWAGRSQYEWCRDRLIQDPDTRQAVINYNQPIHKYQDNKDFVCTLATHFVKREGVLDGITWMRSNDLIYGLTYDLPWFAYVQDKLSKDTQIPLGKLYHYATSLHVYDKHFKMLHEMATDTSSNVHKTLKDIL